MSKLEDILKKRDEEDEIGYLVRLFENKNEYNLNFTQIADLMNFANGKKYGESAYRKFITPFELGREYERKINSIGVVTRILSISDLHIPYQLPIETYSDYRGIVDILQINGDVTDCQAISKFPKSFRISPMEEIISARQYLIDLIDYIQPKKVIVNYGNHDERFSSYLNKNLDTDILELMPETSLELIIDDGVRHYDRRTRAKTWYEPLTKVYTDIEIIYTKDWKCKIGKTWFAHPSAFASGTLRTCEKAMTYFFKTDRDGFDSVILGHTHQTAHSKKGQVNLFEQGACCDVTKMRYSDGRLSDPQKEGFVYICQDKNGNIIEDKSKLIYLN